MGGGQVRSVQFCEVSGVRIRIIEMAAEGLRACRLFKKPGKTANLRDGDGLILMPE
jgi:hypothetical protein